MKNNQYDTLSEASEALRKMGFTENFRVTDDCILADYSGNEYDCSEVILQGFHRFEGVTNPADNTILYAVETKSGVKGTVVDSYGADGSAITSEFMNKVEQNQYKDE